MGVDPLGTPDIDKKQVHTGVHALLEYARKANTDKSFLGESERIDLQICFKKVPRIKNKILKILLPHGLCHATTDVCLFVKDLNGKSRDYSPTVEHFEELLAKNNITSITKVIPLKSLKLDYQPFEAKRNLSNMFDVFLTDDRILRLLPDFLGKNFYGRKRYPIQVNLTAKDLKKEINRALTVSQCIITGRGSSCQMSIGHTSMNEDQIVANVNAAFEKLVSAIPGGAVNIRNLHIKVGDSPGIPVFYSAGSADEVILPPKPKRPKPDEPEEVSVVSSAKVRITPYGKIQFIKEDTAPIETPKKKKKHVGPKKKLKRQQYLAAKKAAKSLGTVTSENASTPSTQIESDISLPVSTGTPSSVEVVDMDTPQIDRSTDSESINPKLSSKKVKKLDKSPQNEKPVKLSKQSPKVAKSPVSVKSPKQSPKMANTPLSVSKKTKTPSKTSPAAATPRSIRLGKRKSLA